MKNIIKDEKGTGHLILIAILALGVLAAVGYYVMVKNKVVVEDSMQGEKIRMEEGKEPVVEEFEELETPEDETTPAEISDEEIDELDSLLLDVEADALTDEDIENL